MRYLAVILITCAVCTFAEAQKVSHSQPLPPPMYAIMRDSTTSIDVVFLQGKGESISLDGKNVHLFNSFFENAPAQKGDSAQAAMIMWQINGKEYLSGKMYLGETTGYVVITKNGREYVNQISEQGNSFFKSQIKK